MRALKISLSIALLLAAESVFACRCLEPADTATAYARAQAVVRAWVDSVQGVGDSPQGAVARLSVKEAWKAEVAEDIIVTTQTTCAFYFEPGKGYVLFLYPGSKDGQWSTRICVGNLALEHAQTALDWLRRRGSKVKILSSH